MSPSIRLYQSHDQAYCAQFANVEQAAASQDQVLVGAPGTIIEHRRGEHVYYARQYMDPEGRKREQSLGGPQGNETVDKHVLEVRQRIELSKSLIERIRELAKLGFQVADNKAAATVAVLYNHWLFQAGAVLIGSHAFGVLLNSLGMRAVGYITEDVDIAREHKLALPDIPYGGLLEILRETGISFVEVPALTRGAPSTSFKQAGAARMHVDLLVPSSGATFPIIAVPELKAHATGLPFLAYLLRKTYMSTLLSRHGAVPVRVPDPARFAMHKLLVSRLRTTNLSKARKDLEQACTLLAMLGEHRSGDIEAACAELPKSAYAHLRKVLPSAERALATAHEGSWLELRDSLRANTAL